MLSCVKATELMEMKENVPLGLLKNNATPHAYSYVFRLQKLYKAEPVIDELIEKKFYSRC